MVINSAADWGISDPLLVPKTAQLMRKSGMDPSEIEKVVWRNPIEFFSASGQISFADFEGAQNVPYAQVNPFETSGFSTGLGGRTLLGTSYSLIVNESGFDRPLGGDRYGFNPVEEASIRLSATQPLLKGAWYPYNFAGIQIAENNRKLAANELEAAIGALIDSDTVVLQQASRGGDVGDGE